jgi:hypothetical protein
MNKIERLANVSVARGCGFAMLGIFTLMIGLAGELATSLRAGGYLCLTMCLVLLLMAWRALSAPYRSTELWIMLEPSERPQPAVAQRVIGTVLREAYLSFALRSAWLAAGMLGMAVLWDFMPGKTAL